MDQDKIKNSTWLPGVMVYTASILAMLSASGLDEPGVLPWQILMVTLLFNIVLYEVIGLFKARWGRYTAISYAVFVVMLVSLYFVAGSMATVPMRELPRFQKFIGLLIIFKVLLTGLAGLYRVVLKFVGHEH